MAMWKWMALMALAACNAPSVHFAGIDPERMSVGPSTFEMRRNGKLVEVIRVNSEWAPRLSQQLGRRAEIAVEETYGCPVREIRGDQAMMIAILKCGKPDDLAKIGQGTKALSSLTTSMTANELVW